MIGKLVTDQLSPPRGLSLWSSGGNLPSNAGDAGLIPGQGTKIPHAMGQVGLHDTITESEHFSTCTLQ